MTSLIHPFEILEGKLNLKEVSGGEITVPGDEPDSTQTLTEALEALDTRIDTLDGTVQQHTTDITNIQNALEWQPMQ